MERQSLFKRPHHQVIRRILSALDHELLERSQTFFGGGTAIVLQLDEYRESVDIDFLCASQAGYRLLREAVWGVGAEGLLTPECDVRVVREIRADQYGIRTAFQVDGVAVKFEIVREARITLEGEMEPRLGVPSLARADLFAEKLLANADRWNDKSTFNRDVIDLSMMIDAWGPVPSAALEKVRSAYGDTAELALEKARARINDPAWLDKCLDMLSMSRDLHPRIATALNLPTARDPSEPGH